MRCPLSTARAGFSKLVDRALAGEPQRVTRYGKDAVVIVSEEEWNTREPKDANLGELPVAYGDRGAFNLGWTQRELNP